MSTRGPSWKHSGGAGSNRPAASRKAWQPGKPASTRVPVSTAGRYRRRIVAAAICLGLLVGLIVAAIILIDPPKDPTLVVVAPGTPESTAVPANVGAGGADLTGPFDVKDSKFRVAKAQDPPVPVGDWHQNIDPKTKNPIVLHFACPGAADKDGPFLWFVPPDAADAFPHRLRLQSVLTYLRDLPNDPPILLTLDAAAEPAAWARGQLHNDFARQLKKLDAEIRAVPKLVVICSADEDQRSWVSEDRRMTAFTHFLREELRGVNRPASDRVTAAKLFTALKKNVSDWAQVNRDAAQKPFLLPAGPEGDARAEDLLVVALGPNAVPGSDLPPDAGYPQALTDAWKRAADRAGQSPPPEATAPHLWRQYLDLLLKADKAARVTRDVPPAVLARLTKLEGELNLRPWAETDLVCLPYSLPAAGALWAPRKDVPVELLLPALDAATPAARQAAWLTAAKEIGPGKPDNPEIRLAAADALLRYLAGKASDKAALGKAVQLLEVIDGKLARPVETHLVHMFNAHLADRDPDLVRRALLLQVEAEKAAWFSGAGKDYPHAEQAARWFAEDLQKTDKRRRELIDLVFGAKTADVPGADPAVGLAKALDDTRQTYADLAKEAAEVGAAYRLRDEVLTRLPYYGRWAAARRVNPAEAEPKLKQIERLAEKAHQLAFLLDAPTPGNTRAVRDLADALRAGSDDAPGFRRLAAEFDTLCGKLATNTAANPSDWHAIDAALEVPFIAPKTRADLAAKARSISHDLETKGTPSGADPSKEDYKEMAQRQGRMALAALGTRGFEARSGGLTVPEIRNLVEQPKEAWWESLAKAGDEVGTAYTELPKQAAAKAKKGSQGEPGSAAEEVRRAAALARLADGATELREINPVAVERRYWTHRLLVAQATRAALDGWAHLQAGETAYAQTAGTAYLDAADAVLFSGSPIPTALRGPWRTHIAAAKPLPAPRFDLAALSKFYVTDKKTLDLPYQITPSGGAAGYPVLRVRTAAKAIVSPTHPAGEYVPVTGFTAPRTDRESRTLPLNVVGSKDDIQGGLTLELLYRGRVVPVPITAEYAGDPTYHWVYNPPSGPASVAVQGNDALAGGSVAFLMDASASMLDPPDGQPGATKYKRALDGLKEVFQKLPVGTRVSLHFFAGNEGGLTKVIPPTVWDDPIRQGAALAELLDKRKPDGGSTPIAEAVERAFASPDVFAKDAAGFRSLLVVTDGAEWTNAETPKNPTSTPGTNIVKTLNDAQKTRDVALHLVRFGLTEAEYNASQTQFGPIEVKKSFAENRTPAALWPRKEGVGPAHASLRESGDLVKVLRESMLPRVGMWAGDKNFGHLPLSLPTTDGWWWLRPGVDAGVYQLLLEQARQQIQFDPGDRLILKLARGKDGLEFTLPSYADARGGLTDLDRSPRSGSGIVMTVPRIFLTQNGGNYDLELTTTLEKPQGVRPDGRLFRELPRFVWFEVEPRNAAAGARPASTKVTNLHHRWAPAWQVVVGPWVPQAGQTDVSNASAAAPKATGYWLDQDLAAPARIELPSFRTADRDLKPAAKTFRVEDGDVRDLRLTVKDGSLRVELEHDPGKPVVVRVSLQGLTQRWTLGEDHKFFGNANKYTAEFTGVRPEDWDRSLTLEFYAISRVKAQSKQESVDVQRRPTDAARDSAALPELTEIPRSR